MIDINQVQRDFDNGVMLCRETIRQVIELAGKSGNSEGAHTEFAKWFGPLPENPTTEFLAIAHWAELGWHTAWNLSMKSKDGAHDWSGDGERCAKCGDKDWYAGPVCSKDSSCG